MKFFVQTYGCQMNLSDSEEMSRHLFRRGFTSAATEEEADILLLNTCTVRQHAEDKMLSFIGRMDVWKKEKPNRILIVTGCAAERLKDRLKKRFPFVDLVIGAKSIEKFPKQVDGLLTFHKPDSPLLEKEFNWFRESETSFGEGDLRSLGEPFYLGNQKETAFVTIMRGCNYSCSYCIVPSVRGREIYRPIDKILEEIRQKVNEGSKKVMLLGQTVNSYWQKEKRENGEWKITDFADLIGFVNKIEELEEIRFMSPHPYYMTDKLIDTLSTCKKVSPQIHLPVQSGSNKILKAMKRNYGREEYIKIVQKLRKTIPDLQLTTDFIVGFPGETEEDFKETLSLLEEVSFESAYCFKFSPRLGTEAFHLSDPIPQKTKKERLSRLFFHLEQNKKKNFSPCFVV